MKIKLLSPRLLFLISALTLLPIFDYFLYLKGIEVIFIAVIAIIQFYLTFEIASKLDINELILDFRTQEKKQEDEYNKQLLMIEVAKNNLLFQIQDGILDESEATSRLQDMIAFVEEKNINLALPTAREEEIKTIDQQLLS